MYIMRLFSIYNKPKRCDYLVDKRHGILSNHNFKNVITSNDERGWVVLFLFDSHLCVGVDKHRCSMTQILCKSVYIFMDYRLYHDYMSR